MMKKLLLYIVGFLGLCVIGILLFVKDFEVKISEEDAQSAFNAQLDAPPIRRLGVEIEIHSATLDFQPDNTMKFDTEFTADVLGYSSNVNGTFQSGIRYASPKIYLDDISPAEVNISTDEDTRKELAEIKSAAQKFLDRQKNRMGGGEEPPAKTDNSELKKSIERATYAFFEYIPIYDLNNAGYKGSMASLALKDVRFHEDYVLVTLSPKQAMLRILAIISFILLLIGWFAGPSLIQFYLEHVLEKTNSDDSKSPD